MSEFVVYAFCREDSTFYYIGKGRPQRPYESRKEGIKPPKDRSRILILHENLTEELAFQYEKKLIQFYGRMDLGEGLLRNMTNGGEGVAGWIPGEDWRLKKSESMRGENNPFYGKNHSQETIRNSRKGKCAGEENYFFGVRLFGELNPMYGKKRPDLAERNRQSPTAKGTKWYNNGEIDKRFHPDLVPDGFEPGRLRVGRGHKRPDLAERNRKRKSS
jgi:hypothetical protein